MSCQPYRDFRKKDQKPAGASAGPGSGPGSAPTKMSVGKMSRFGVTSFTSIRNSVANGSTKDNLDAFSFEDDNKSGSPTPPPVSDLSPQSAPPQPKQSRPKKFFKSRNRDSAFDSLFSSGSTTSSTKTTVKSPSVPKPASPAVPSPLSSTNKSSSSSPVPQLDSPLALSSTGSGSPAPSTPSQENVTCPAAVDAPDDPPSTFSRRAPSKSYGRKRNAADSAADCDGKSKEPRTIEPHVEYENPLLKMSGDSSIDLPSVTATAPEVVEDVQSNEKPSGGGGRKTFFKSKKTDPVAAKAKAVSRYRFNFTGEDEFGEKKPVAVEPFKEKTEEPPKEVKKSAFDDKDFTAPPAPFLSVVRNVKKAYEVHEIGEAQEFNDDVEYLLESVTSSNSLVSRCLSVCSLASKCMSSSFRVHLRAHGIMSKFFESVKDAPKHQQLALCVSCLFFVLSQDRLTMDLEASTLAILLQLFEITECSGEGKHKEKVLQMCETMRSKGHAKHLRMDNITASSLALETLLSLTSRRAGEWFKEELRIQGGLTHLANLVHQTLASLGTSHFGVISDPTKEQLDKLRKVDRVLKVLENITFANEANQDYLIKFRNGLVLDYCCDLMNLCYENIEYHKVLNISDVLDQQTEGQSISVALQKAEGPGPVFLSVMLSLLKVLLNITHENDESSDNLGTRHVLMRQLIESMLHVPYSLDIDLRFDLQLLGLGLTINICEHSSKSREWFEVANVKLSSDTEMTVKHNALESLVRLFREKQEAAARTENQTDEILTNQEQKFNEQQQKKLEDNPTKNGKDDKDAADDLEETIRKAIQKAGKHMEHSIISAYLSLLLGCIIQGNEDRTQKLKALNGDSLLSFRDALKKFHDFIDLTGVLGNSAPQSIQRILKVLETS